MRDRVRKILASLRPGSAMEWLTVALIALVLVAILAGCSTPRSAQVFVTANGDRVEIWCTDSLSHPNQLHTRMLDYPSDNGQPIVNDNDPYCRGGASGSYIVNDPWWNGWVGYHYYQSPLWSSRHQGVSITNVTNVSTTHNYAPPAGAKVTPGNVSGGVSESAATKTAKAVTGTLPPPKVTAAPAPKTTKTAGTLPPPKPGDRIPSGTPAPPVSAPKATTPSKTLPPPKATAPKPATPRPPAPKPPAPRPPAPRPPSKSGK